MYSTASGGGRQQPTKSANNEITLLFEHGTAKDAAFQTHGIRWSTTTKSPVRFGAGRLTVSRCNRFARREELAASLGRAGGEEVQPRGGFLRPEKNWSGAVQSVFLPDITVCRGRATPARRRIRSMATGSHSWARSTGPSAMPRVRKIHPTAGAQGLAIAENDQASNVSQVNKGQSCPKITDSRGRSTSVSRT